MKNIDGQHPRPPVLAILLETIERENFDASLAYCQICQYVLYPVKKLHYTVCSVRVHCMSVIFNTQDFPATHS